MDFKLKLFFAAKEKKVGFEFFFFKIQIRFSGNWKTKSKNAKRKLEFHIQFIKKL